MVAKFHILINISKYWNHELDPDRPQQAGFGFGGGIINGEPGYLMRACITATIDANPTGATPLTRPDYHGWSNAELDPASPGYRRRTPRSGACSVRSGGRTRTAPTEYFCEDGTSRDAYAGTTSVCSSRSTS